MCSCAIALGSKMNGFPPSSSHFFPRSIIQLGSITRRERKRVRVVAGFLDPLSLSLPGINNRAVYCTHHLGVLGSLELGLWQRGDTRGINDRI